MKSVKENNIIKENILTLSLKEAGLLLLELKRGIDLMRRGMKNNPDHTQFKTDILVRKYINESPKLYATIEITHTIKEEDDEPRTD